MLSLLVLSLAAAFAAEPDVLVADFEGDTYGAWTAAGSAFGRAPARGALPGQMSVDGYVGRGLVNSFLGGDAATGTLTSPPFQIQRRYLSFLMGGGQFPGQTCMDLLVNGQAVRTATGPNAAPGGSERLQPAQWDVSDLRGQTVSLRIVDQATGGWGHINVDQIVQSDVRLPGLIANAKREIVLKKQYLHLPVKNGAPKRLMTIRVDGQILRQFEIELADSQPDWWAYAEFHDCLNKTATVEVDQLREDSAGLSAIEQSDDVKGAEPLYREKLRPQFHFTSRRGWNNDPNGLVYYRGEYHLFYQHNPYGWNWGNMHWGHAISTNLVHWQEVGEALYPDAQGTMFSGSAVVDERNTAGFQTGAEKPIALIYTAAGGTSARSKGQKFTQGLAYSNDRGRTWTKYEKNPVLGHIRAENRDPKVIWHEPTKKWVMALYLDKNDFTFFGSTDLKSWTHLSDLVLARDIECPDLFELPVQGRSGESRWIFYGANGTYLVGAFDGVKFTAESGPHPLNYGNCFYAAQTFSDIPAADGRRIMIGWGRVNLPGMPFNQMMDFPVSLTLRETPAGPRLFTLPVAEIDSLRAGVRAVPAQPLRPGENPFANLGGELLDMSVDLSLGEAEKVGLNVRGVPVTYDHAQRKLFCLTQSAPLEPVNGRIKLRLLVDRASIEIFANDGQVYMPNGVLLDEKNLALEAFATGGAARLNSATVATLKSAWR